MKYKPAVLVIFILSFGCLILMNTGTRVVKEKSVCPTSNNIDCSTIAYNKVKQGRYSEYTGIEIALSIIVIISGSTYIYSNLLKKNYLKNPKK
jgi:hypothetical protein